MNTEKFTPGEWHKTTDNKYILSKNGTFICDIDDNYTDTGKANATLIAAAPDMYKRLKSVKIDLWALSVNPTISEQTKECIDIIIKNIEDDLKKARGEE